MVPLTVSLPRPKLTLHHDPRKRLHGGHLGRGEGRQGRRRGRRGHWRGAAVKSEAQARQIFAGALGMYGR